MPGEATEVVPYLTSAALIFYAQKFLKTRTSYGHFVKAFPAADKWAHRFIAGFGALIAATGIHFTFNYDIVQGGTAHFTIPDLWTMVHGIGDWVKVFTLQQFAYDCAKQPPYVPKE